MASLGNDLKYTARQFTNWLRFPSADLAKGVFIETGTKLGPRTTIGRGSCVFNSVLHENCQLGGSVFVSSRCRLANTRVGDVCRLEEEDELFAVELSDHVSVHAQVYLCETKVGRYSYIGRGSYLNDVEVGAFSSIGPQALIGTGEHPVDLVSTSPAFYSTRKQCGATFASRDHVVERHRVKIGNDVWIGAKVFIRDGVSVGDGAIIAAGAVVTKDVAPYSIVGGVPAKPIRSRFDPAIVEKLLSLRWWTWDDRRLKEAQPLIAQSDPLPLLAWAAKQKTGAANVQESLT
jgi:chloramphenicol O-acetyltransferase type B